MNYYVEAGGPSPIENLGVCDALSIMLTIESMSGSGLGKGIGMGGPRIEPLNDTMTKKSTKLEEILGLNYIN
jgi:hypothetical protein